VASSAIEDGYANYLRRRDVDKKKKKKKATDNNDEQKKGAPPPSLEARASALVKKSKKLEKAVADADKASEFAEAEEAVAARLTTRAKAMAFLEEAPLRELPQFLAEGGGRSTKEDADAKEDRLLAGMDPDKRVDRTYEALMKAQVLLLAHRFWWIFIILVIE
jgi:hypothetical protein